MNEENEVNGSTKPCKEPFNIVRRNTIQLRTVQYSKGEYITLKKHYNTVEGSRIQSITVQLRSSAVQ